MYFEYIYLTIREYWYNVPCSDMFITSTFEPEMYSISSFRRNWMVLLLRFAFPSSHTHVHVHYSTSSRQTPFSYVVPEKIQI